MQFKLKIMQTKQLNIGLVGRLLVNNGKTKLKDWLLRITIKNLSLIKIQSKYKNKLILLHKSHSNFSNARINNQIQQTQQILMIMMMI